MDQYRSNAVELIICLLTVNNVYRLDMDGYRSRRVGDDVFRFVVDHVPGDDCAGNPGDAEDVDPGRARSRGVLCISVIAWLDVSAFHTRLLLLLGSFSIVPDSAPTLIFLPPKPNRLDPH